jgi:hypothetical protein
MVTIAGKTLSVELESGRTRVRDREFGGVAR